MPEITHYGTTGMMCVPAGYGLSAPIVAVKVGGAAAFDGVAALPPSVGVPFEKRLRRIWKGDSRM